MDKISNIFSKDLVLLDGALGTELLRRGIPTPVPLWSAEAINTHPEVILQIHKDYLMAGADVITANTYRTHRRAVEKKYPKDKHPKVDHAQIAIELSTKTCEIANRARLDYKPEALVAASITTVEDCYSPELVPDRKTLQAEHEETLESFASQNVDFIACETFNTLMEASIVAETCLKKNLPFAISLVCNNEGNLLSGEDLITVAKKLEEYSPLYIGLNCSSPHMMLPAAEKLIKNLSTPIAVYANGMGKPDDAQGWAFSENLENDSRLYSKAAKSWYNAGVKIIGGCCGTTPDHILALSKLLPSETR